MCRHAQQRNLLTPVVLWLRRDEQVDYDGDDLWNQWNVTAKLRILTNPILPPPAAQYYIEHKTPGSVATSFSSLAPSHKSSRHNAPAAQCHTEHKTQGSVATPFSSLAPSHKPSRSNEQGLVVFSPPISASVQGLYESTSAYPNVINRTPGSCTDSEATIAFEQLEEWNKKRGTGFESITHWGGDEETFEKVGLECVMHGVVEKNQLTCFETRTIGASYESRRSKNKNGKKFEARDKLWCCLLVCCWMTNLRSPIS
jgi:hypothetical protein